MPREIEIQQLLELESNGLIQKASFAVTVTLRNYVRSMCHGRFSLYFVILCGL